MKKKEILAIIRRIEKFLIFLDPKPFLVRTDCKGILWKRIYQICKCKGDSYAGNYSLTSFSSLLSIYRNRRTLWQTVWLENSPIVIIKADLLPEAEEILNEMSFFLERVSPSSKVLIENLEFHTKSRLRFGLLSTAYLITQRFSLLELQVNYLDCPYDIQEKIRSHVRKKWFNEWYAACIDFYHYYSYDIWESWGTTIYSLDKSEVGGLSFPANSLYPNNLVFKVWEYGMVLYVIEIPYPKFPFFSKLTKF